MARTSVRIAASVEKLAAACKKNRVVVLTAALFFVGMVYGALLIGFGEEELLSSLGVITKEYLTERTKQPIFDTFFSSLFSSGIFVLLLFLLGFGAISAPVILFLPFFKGLGLGASMGYLYAAYGLKGVAFSAAILLPAALFSSFAIILAAREAFRLSLLFLSGFVPRIRGTLSPRVIKLYCLKFLILFGIVLFSAVIDSAATFLFSGFLVL